jgi:quercetin 2,3-dioxygenase
MITLRHADERGHFDHGWLKTYHTFSFGEYFDPSFMGFHSLRVINEDYVQPGTGFPMHAHRDMEIITIVLDGALQHKDSVGNGSVIRPGDVQRMSAGTGIRHSEFNPSQNDPVHLLQIWLLPERSGLDPGYEQISFKPESAHNRLYLLAAQASSNGALTIHQDAKLYICSLSGGQSLDTHLAATRHAWLQVIQGELDLNGQAVHKGDGAAISKERLLRLNANQPSQFLLFDLA